MFILFFLPLYSFPYNLELFTSARFEHSVLRRLLMTKVCIIYITLQDSNARWVFRKFSKTFQNLQS